MAMKMVYIHIPFCKTKCAYCDFYSLKDLNFVKIFLKNLIKEIDLRYKNEKISSIYFGGGTPSLLDPTIISDLISNFNKAKDCEITIECNPEDINYEKIIALKNAGVNRFSLGVQSLNDFELKLLKRRHNKKQALEALKIIKENIRNFNCDIIIGIKSQNKKILQKTFKELLSYSPPHISVYPLEVKKKSFLMENEDKKAELLKFAWRILKENGYIHYEISNFAKNGFISKHNFGYWTRKDYYGFGPSAHSLIENERFSNFRSLKKYIEFINKSKLPISKKELLEKKEVIWEKFILSMRTNEGFPLKYFNDDALKIYEELNYVYKNNNNLCLTEDGMLLYNSIILKLKDLLVYPL